MSIAMDVLEKKLIRVIDDFNGKEINAGSKKEFKKSVSVILEDFFRQVNPLAPTPTVLVNFDDSSGRGELHLKVEFLHPNDNQEISLLEWEDEFEDGRTQ